ncbi:hypothetical protein P7K49_006020, partial [Saguinus oedipus]
LDVQGPCSPGYNGRAAHHPQCEPHPGDGQQPPACSLCRPSYPAPDAHCLPDPLGSRIL